MGIEKIQQGDSRISQGPDADAKRQKNDKGEKGEKGEVMSLEQVLAKRKEENKVPIRVSIWINFANYDWQVRLIFV